VALTENDITEEFVIIDKSIYGTTKTVAGNRQVPYFGYFKSFPKSRHAIASILSEHGATIHSLRKNCPYFLKCNNAHVTAAAKFLGHSNPLITLIIYTLVKDDEVIEIGMLLKNN